MTEREKIKELEAVIERQRRTNAELQESTKDAEASIEVLRTRVKEAKTELTPIQGQLELQEKELIKIKEQNSEQKKIILSFDGRMAVVVAERNKNYASWKEAEKSLTEITESLEQFNNLYKVARKIIGQKKLLSKAKLRAVSKEDGK